MVTEVEKLLATGIDRSRFDMFGMEYKHVDRYLRKIVSMETMLEHLERDIVRLAKRQMTYFRGMERRGIPINWLEGALVDVAIMQINAWFDTQR